MAVLPVAEAPLSRRHCDAAEEPVTLFFFPFHFKAVHSVSWRYIIVIKPFCAHLRRSHWVIWLLKNTTINRCACAKRALMAFTHKNARPIPLFTPYCHQALADLSVDVKQKRCEASTSQNTHLALFFLRRHLTIGDKQGALSVLQFFRSFGIE